MRYNYEPDTDTFSADAYKQVGGRYAVAWDVLGWHTEPNEDTEWSGYETRTGMIVCVMVGDDAYHLFDPEDMEPLPREDYCDVCGQIGCSHDGLDRD